MTSQIRKIFRTGAVRGITALGTLLFNYTLTVNLSINDVGIFLSLLTEITLLATVSRFGFESYLVLLIGSKSFSPKENSQIINSAFKLVLMLSISIMIISLIIHYYFFNSNGYKLLIVLPFVSLLLLMSSIFRGYKKPILSVILENGGYLTLSSFFIMTFSYLGANNFISIYAGFFLSVFVLLLISIIIFNKYEINLKKTKHNQMSIIRAHIKPAFYLMLSNLSQILLIWTPFIIISFMSNPSETALYGLSQRLSFSISLFLTVVTIVMSPYFSKYFHDNNLKKLKSAYFQATLFISPIVLLFVGVIFIWSTNILNYFGEEYIQASSIFKVLLASQTLSFLLGPIGTIYNMTHQAKRLSFITFFVVLLTIIFSIITFSLFGIIGVAYTSLTIVVLHKFSLLTDFYFRHYKHSL